MESESEESSPPPILEMETNLVPDPDRSDGIVPQYQLPVLEMNGDGTNVETPTGKALRAERKVRQRLILRLPKKRSSKRVPSSRSKTPHRPSPDDAQGQDQNISGDLPNPDTPSQDPIAANEAGVSTQEILGQDSMTEPELFVNQETGAYGNTYLHPELINCMDLIQPPVIRQLAHPQAQQALAKIFESVGIVTIGDLSRQTEIDVIKWPLIPPKCETVRKVLEKYQLARQRQFEEAAADVLNETNDDGASDDDPTPSFVVANLKRTYSRKRPMPKVPQPSFEVSQDETVADTSFKDDPIARQEAEATDLAALSINLDEDLSITDEELPALDEILQFLRSGGMHAHEFLHTFLADDAVADSILKRLVERDDFEKRVWDVCRTKFFTKPPLLLCDSLMTERVKAKYLEMYNVEIPVRIPKNFWMSTFDTLIDSYAQSYRQVMKTNPTTTDETPEGQGQKLDMDQVHLLERIQSRTWANFLKNASTIPDRQKESSYLDGSPATRVESDTEDMEMDSSEKPPPESPETPESEKKPSRVAEIVETLNSMSQEDLSTVFLTLFNRAQGNM